MPVTVRGEGPRPLVTKLTIPPSNPGFCATSVERVSSPSPQVSGRSPLLERDRELMVLTGVAAEASRGARAVVVTGEAGIGKSRICQEFWETLPTGWDRVDAAGYQGGYEPPFAALLQSVGEEAGPQEVGAALAAELTSRAGTSGVVVVLEDLQWMHPVTAPALAEALRRLRQVPLLVIATFRTGAHSPGSPTSRAVAALTRDFAVTELRLAALSPAAVSELARALGADPSRTNPALYERTGGVPFFVEEVVRAGGTDVPWTVTEAVLSQLDDVDPAAREALVVLTVAARPLKRSVLRALDAAFDQAVVALGTAGLVDVDHGSARLRHALVGEAIESALTDHDRRTAHARLAAALQEVEPDARELIAVHWLEAGEHELAARQTVEMSDAAAIPPPDALANPNAGAQFELLAIAAAQADDFAHAFSLAEAAERAYRALGDDRRADALWERDALRPAAALRESTASGGSYLELATRSREALVDGRLDEAHALATRMRRQIGAHTPADPRIRCAVALLEAGDVAAAETVLAGAERYAREHGLSDELAMIGSRRAWLAFGRGHAGEALAHLATAAVEAHRSPEGVFRIYFDPIHAFVLAACGEIEQARAYADELLAREGVGIFGAFPMALVDYERGEVTGALDRLAAVMPFVEALAEDDVSSDFTSVLALQAMLELGAGRAAEALSIANRCLVADRSAVSASRSDLLLTVVRASLALSDRSRAADAVNALGDHARWATGPGAQAAATVGDALLDVDAGRFADAADRYEAAARAYELSPRWANAAEAWCDAADAAIACGREPARALDAARRLCEQKGLGRVAARVAEVATRAQGSGQDGLAPALQSLSRRELEVVRLVAQGLTNREIGDAMYLSEGTVRNYLSRCFDKLGVTRRADVVRLVATSGDPGAAG